MTKHPWGELPNAIRAFRMALANRVAGHDVAAEYTIDPKHKVVWYDPDDGLIHVREVTP